MAKTTDRTFKFSIVDLVRSKPKLEYIEIPAYKVDVEFTITTTSKFKKPAEAPDIAGKRMRAVGEKELERYEKIIKEESVKLDKKIGVLMKTPGKKAQDEAEKLIQGTNQSIMNALNSAQGAAQVAIAKQLKVEANKDKLLTEARVKTTLKVTKSFIKIGTSVTRAVASSGADVLAYKTIAKEIYNLGKEIQQQRKGEEKLRKDLYEAILKYIKLRGTTIMQAAERQGITDTKGLSIKKPLEAISTLADKALAMGDEVAKGRDKKQIAKEIADFAIKGYSSYQKSAETKRQKYREHTTKTRQKVDSMGQKADKMWKIVKKQKTLEEGVKLGAECMGLKRDASAMAAKLEERQKFLGEMEALMAGNGLKVDDTTIVDKIKKLDKMTVLKEGAAMVTSVKGVYTLVDEISDLVG